MSWLCNGLAGMISMSFNHTFLAPCQGYDTHLHLRVITLNISWRDRLEDFFCPHPPPPIIRIHLPQPNPIIIMFSSLNLFISQLWSSVQGHSHFSKLACQQDIHHINMYKCALIVEKIKNILFYSIYISSATNIIKFGNIDSWTFNHKTGRVTFHYELMLPYPA